MSRIGRKTITIPEKVKITIKDTTVNVEGRGGQLPFKHNPQVHVKLKQPDKTVVCSIDEKINGDNRQVGALWGTTRATIATMIEGVTKGYSEVMEVVGVGWTGALVGNTLKLTVGFANPIILNIPTGVKVTVEKQIVTVSGPNKKDVGQFASDMRGIRKPEPYNGKGIKYKGETIKRKSGKAFGAA